MPPVKEGFDVHQVETATALGEADLTVVDADVAEMRTHKGSPIVHMSSSESDLSKRILVKKLPAKKNPFLTIGLLGANASSISRINELFIEAGCKMGYKDDQDHPDYIAIAHLPSLDIKSKFKYSLELLKDLGCQSVFIDIPGIDKKSEIYKYAELLGLRVLFTGKDYNRNSSDEVGDILSEEIDKALSDRDRENFRSYNPQEIQLSESVCEALQSRKERIMGSLSKKVDKYKFIKEYVGVIGGAGPQASANHCKYLAQEGLPFIHYSLNCAPGKHRFETGVGPSYIPFYDFVTSIFDKLGISQITIPCNTAHKRLEEYCSPSTLQKVVDIRRSSFEEIAKYSGAARPQAIILGTDFTVGVTSARYLPKVTRSLDSEHASHKKDDGQVERRLQLLKADPHSLACVGGALEQEGFFLGSYQKFANENSFLIKLYPPTSPQMQDDVLKIIYDVKAGKDLKCQQSLLSIIKSIRDHIGDRDGEVPVILACTELPLALSQSQMMENNCIDPSFMAASQAYRKFIESKTLTSSSVSVSCFSRAVDHAAAKKQDLLLSS